ncbi:MAG: tryptophan synthase subunit alpha [Acidimicrobiia bacterium]
MNLEAHLRDVRAKNRKILAPYVTGGLGSDWTDAVRACIDNGADALEISIPFSDPLMDGPVIQAANQRALDHGAIPDDILKGIAALDAPVPLLIMTYYNVVHHYGHERFARACADRGVAGTIIPDLPFDEGGDWIAAAESHGVENVLLVAPSTTDTRLVDICERTRGFVYSVAHMGVTGERVAIADETVTTAARIQAVTDKPVLIGFGISGPNQAAAAAQHADGVIVASALVRRLLEGESADDVGAFVQSLRAAIDA